MKWKSMTEEARVRFVTRAIVAAGFACAIVIYVVNVLTPDAAGFELEESKKYLRDMEVFGGTANVLATQLRQGFDALWHGKTLALTVAVLSLLVAFAYNFLATPLPPHVAAGERESGEPRGAE
jgi:hypothetical protein